MCCAFWRFTGHLKTLAVGERVRVRGEFKSGLWGREMVHPVFKPAGGPLPEALTPVCPHQCGPAAGLSAQGREHRGLTRAMRQHTSAFRLNICVKLAICA